MSNDEQKQPMKLDLADLVALSGAAPVLRTENPKHYETMRDHFMAHLAPEDVVVWLLVDRLVKDTWFIMRYSRHQTVAIERSFQQSLEFQLQRRILRKAKKEALAKTLAEKNAQNPPEVAQLVYLEKTVGDPVEEIDEILERTPTEIEHNRALERTILFQEQLDRLVSNATNRFNQTLELIEHYKEGLGQRLRQAAEELLRPKNAAQDEKQLINQTGSLSIVPPGEGTLDGDAKLDGEAINQTPSIDEEVK